MELVRLTLDFDALRAVLTSMAEQAPGFAWGVLAPDGWTAFSLERDADGGVLLIVSDAALEEAPTA